MFFQKDPPGFYIETIHKEYTATDPVFFDTNDYLPWTRDLEAATDAIIADLGPALAEDFQDLELNGEDRFQFPPKIWKGIMFNFHGFDIKKNIERYPVIAAHLAKIPNLVLASVSILEPGSHLLPHNGNSNGVARYHLGLNIPATMPDCGFIIGGNEVSWEKGKSFMFCNMNVHSAHNKTTKRRHILLLDVVRPEFLAVKKKMCVHTLAKRMTNITSDKLRVMFNIKVPKSQQDPTKVMEYKANKGYKSGEIETLDQRILRNVEDRLLPMYIAFFWCFFIFKKMQ